MNSAQACVWRLSTINHLGLLRSTPVKIPDKNLDHVQDDTHTALTSPRPFCRRVAVSTVVFWSLNMTFNAIATAAIANRPHADGARSRQDAGYDCLQLV